MRILLFNYEYPPLGGGAGNATQYILREFVKNKNLQIDLITSSSTEEFQAESLGKNVKIYKLPIGKNNHNFHYQSQKDLLVYSWKAFWFSKKLIKKNNYDLTHSFFAVPCGFISWLIYKQFKIPYVVSLRGSDVPGYSDRFGIIYKLITPLIKMIWNQSGEVVANSNSFKKLAQKTSPHQKITVITNGIDIEEFKEKNCEQRKYNEKFKILCGTRITHRKGFIYIIEAIAILKNTYPDIFLQIIGDGNQKEELKKLVEEKKLQKYVEFLGVVNHKKISRYYTKANIFISASLNEGMSNAMLEALASGLPIIATNTGGTDELIKNGNNGFVIRKKNSKDIVKKVEKIITDFDLEKKMSLSSRRLAEKMTWRDIAKKYYAVYNRINDKE